MRLNAKNIRRLIHIVEESEIESLEIRRFFRTIRITKSQRSKTGNTAAVPAPCQVESPNVPVVASAIAPPVQLIEIKSPMVGTFYSAPTPGAPPFVAVGQQINIGDIVCIIEAMKLMNEIEAEQAGRIAKVIGRDGHPVEFGQVLFLLEPMAQ